MDARAGRAWYLTWVERYAHEMGEQFTRSHEHARTCDRVRELAKIARAKAVAFRKRWEAWRDEWNWHAWLPAKFYRVARCETGVRWDWDSGTYVSAFGIIRVAYEWYHPWTGHNTPREQYEVAAAIQRRFGWGAWGCGGA